MGKILRYFGCCCGLSSIVTTTFEKLAFAPRPNRRSCMSRSPCETDLQTEIIRVVAARAANRVSGGIMDGVKQNGTVRRDRPVAAQLPVRACVATRSTRRPSHRKTRKHVDGIGSRLPPLSGYGSGQVDHLCRVKRDRRFDVNEIGESRVIGQVVTVREQRIERFEPVVIWVAVARRDVDSEPETRRQGNRIKSVAD